MVNFDAYTATTTSAKRDDLGQVFFDVLGLGNFKLKTGKGFHTFSDRLAFCTVEGQEVGAVQWGGRQGDRVMLEVKGEHSPAVVETFRKRFPHRVTRVDACADFDAPGAFQRLYKACRTVKKAHGIVGGKFGDWEDFPEKGRTLYLGARSSVTRARLYEKGLQPEYQHLNKKDWVRLEVQVRPAGDAKFEYSKVSPLDVWGASKWSRDIAAQVLKEHIDPHPAGSVNRLSERENALRWMCKQYGAHLVSLAHDLGGWDCVGLTLSEMISEIRIPLIFEELPKNDLN